MFLPFIPHQSSKRSKAYELGLNIVVLDYNLGHMIDSSLCDRKSEAVIDCLIKRLIIKVRFRVSYYARSWYVHVALALPLAPHYRAVLA
jgi:hypothetical protein